MQRCVVPECDGKPYGHGWCMKHYTRWRRHGDPLVPGRTPAGTVSDWIASHADFAGDECLPWPFSKNASGYGVAWTDGRQTSAQQAMCRAAHGPPPSPTHEAAHSCGAGALGCINPRHLRWATHAENQADQLCHGTRARGERQGSARLTEDDVRAIRALAQHKLQREIAAEYGITQPQVSRLLRGVQWGWLDTG